MKTIIINSILVLLIFISNSTLAQDRNIVWVHGLGGSQASWQHYDDLFDNERKINSIRGTHNTENGIVSGAITHSTSVQNFVDTQLGSEAQNPQNLAVGHSMGGLMIREIDRTTSSSNRRFGGLITVNSPNEGAYVSNSVLNGVAATQASYACSQLTAGPNASGFTKILFDNIDTDDMCVIQDASFVYNFIPENSVDDLAEESQEINDLNSYSNSIPKIAIWSHENSPVHWRLLSTMINDNPNLTTNPSINNKIAAISQPNDYWLLSVVNISKIVYSTMETLYNVIGNFCMSIPFRWFAYCRAEAVTNYYKASQWKKGRLWLHNSESIWSTLIGATQIQEITYQTWEWVPCPYPPNHPVKSGRPPIDPDPNDCGYWILETHTTYTTVHYPSDGLLPTYTQKNIPGIPSGNLYKITGANHFEVKNMSNSPQGDLTKAEFDNIFDRNDIFKTYPR